MAGLLLAAAFREMKTHVSRVGVAGSFQGPRLTPGVTLQQGSTCHTMIHGFANTVVIDLNLIVDSGRLCS